MWATGSSGLGLTDVPGHQRRWPGALPTQGGIVSNRLPKGWKHISGGGIACRHRDLAVCPKCQDAHVEVVNVYEELFWVGDEDERAELLDQLAAMGCAPTVHQRKGR